MSAFETATVGYIERREESVVLDHVQRVRGDGQSRVLLLYGGGGVGKTTLVQQLARNQDGPDDVVWVRPIDVDDSEFWLLSNMEKAVAQSIDPGREYFGRYFDELSQLPLYSDVNADYESVLSHLGQINRTFLECYQDFIERSERAVVITLDTIEAIRSMYALLTLTRWMKEVPGTLFVLAGRPPSGDTSRDPVRAALGDPHRPLEHTEITLRGFDEREALRFIENSPVVGDLGDEAKRRLIDLTAGEPLWLALAVEYLQVNDLPREMQSPLEGQIRPRDSFRRSLIALYRGVEFWPEAIKRLAVVRHSVNQDVWTELMSDRELPPGVADWDEAWRQLLRRPWVRPRSNERYVTLHDALAEELVQRLVPLHDQDRRWRHELWRRAKDIYAGLTAGSAEEVQAELARLTAALRSPDQPDRERLIDQVVALDGRKREVDQLRAARLHYTVLDDFATGTDEFLRLYVEATELRDPLFLELICHEIGHLIPHGDDHEHEDDALADVQEFHEWLREKAPERYVQIAIKIADFLIQNEQASAALTMLEGLPEGPSVDPALRHRLAIDRGNACMRIAGRVDAAAEHLQDAVRHARALTGADRVLAEATAHKELGFYYRNLGRWAEADEAYLTARVGLSSITGPDSTVDSSEEMASILTNWAYVRCLRGYSDDARNLIESAVRLRKRQGDRTGNHLLEAVSRSVSGEIYRYESKFIRAWNEYARAEPVFQEARNWPWLGRLYQEQAICLFQAWEDGFTTIVENQKPRTHKLIDDSLEICRGSAPRSYPSALNRAGRIFAKDDVDKGLTFLEEGIFQARRIGDGWFVSANIMDFLETSYREWKDSGDDRYRTGITDRVDLVVDAIATYQFPDLRGRWELLQAHLLVHDALASDRLDALDEALGKYATGFQTLTDERVGSHGSAAIKREFGHFSDLFHRLPDDTKRHWYRTLQVAWSNADSASRSQSLLARIEELY